MIDPGSVSSEDTQRFLGHTAVKLPLIGGPMYPCSNPELVAAISDAGAIGVVQPLSLTLVHGWDFREGLRHIRTLTARPVGMNALIEASSRTYRRRMEVWLEIALEENVRFFITSLGNPRWVVERVAPFGGVVYHDATELKWAAKGVEAGVHGLIGVNRNAGGHAGQLSPAQLLDDLAPLGLPVVAAGGVGDAAGFRSMLDLGYAAVQCGTRFIATQECTASDGYKRAIVAAEPDDIVHTERLTGVPVALIDTGSVAQDGLRAGPVARWMLRHRRTRHFMRTLYALRSLWQLKRSLTGGSSGSKFWQAGRSVGTIHDIPSVATVIEQFRRAL
jgi:nitronate monooxygenase